MTRVGVISDTHGLLRPEALAFLRGCAFVVHAGDIGKPEILTTLRAQAPLTAVRGNNDKDAWAAALPHSDWLHVEQTLFHIVHDLAELAIDPRVAGVDIVIAGHSHCPVITNRDGVVYFNPGSAGPQRFHLPVTVGEVCVNGNQIQARWMEIIRDRGSAARRD